MSAEEPGAEPVERPGPQPLGHGAQRPREPAAQLVCGGAREREGQDLRGLEPLVLDQPLDPMGQDARLPAARAAREQERAGRVRHGRALSRVQRGEGVDEGHACRQTPVRGWKSMDDGGIPTMTLSRVHFVAALLATLTIALFLVSTVVVEATGGRRPPAIWTDRSATAPFSPHHHPSASPTSATRPPPIRART
jgi:hypothetical protein